MRLPLRSQFATLRPLGGPVGRHRPGVDWPPWTERGGTESQDGRATSAQVEGML
jgi:hypothetical protein